jgi:hypothetical protein
VAGQISEIQNFFTHTLYAHTDTKNKTIMLLWVTFAMVTDVHTFPSRNADFFHKNQEV